MVDMWTILAVLITSSSDLTAAGMHSHKLLRISEAPTDWIIKTLRPYWMIFYGAGVPLALWHGMVACFSGHQLAGLAQFALACIFAVAGIWVRNGTCKPEVQHSCLACVFCVSVIFLLCSFHSASDPTYRHRSMASLAIFWRALVPSFGVHMRPCMLCLAVCSVVECLVTQAAMSELQEHSSASKRVTLTLVMYTFAAIGWCYMWICLWQTLHQNERRVTIEKEASESILSMLCDATFWLAADGDTLVDSDHRLEGVIGTKGSVTSLNDFMSETERVRLHVFTRAAETTANAPVHLLPTTLLHAEGVPITVDLFIVDRRWAFSVELAGEAWTLSHAVPAQQRQGFLIGLRLGQPCEAAITPSLEVCAEAECAPQALASLETGTMRSVESRSDQVLSSSCNGCVPMDLEMKVYCEEEGSFDWRSLSSVTTETNVLCVDCYTLEPCMDVIESLQPITQQTWLDVQLEGCTSTVQLPARVRVLQKSSRRGRQNNRWRSLQRTVSRKDSCMHFILCDEPARNGVTETRCRVMSADKASQLSSSGRIGLRLCGGEHHAVVAQLTHMTMMEGTCEPSGRCTRTCVALAAPHVVSFSDADSLSTRSLSSVHDADPHGHPSQMPSAPASRFGPPYVPANEYFAEVVLSMIEDIVKASNLETSGCCHWHSGLNRIAELVGRMHKWRACDEVWPPLGAATWQCTYCTAVIDAGSPIDFCWLCQAERQDPKFA